MFGSVGPVQPGFQRSESEHPPGHKKKKKPPRKNKGGHHPTEPRYSVLDPSEDHEHLDMRV